MPNCFITLTIKDYKHKIATSAELFCHENRRFNDSGTRKAARTIREKTEEEQETPLRVRTMRGQAKLGSRALCA